MNLVFRTLKMFASHLGLSEASKTEYKAQSTKYVFIAARVAQLDRAFDFESKGRRFEPCRAHQPFHFKFQIAAPRTSLMSKTRLRYFEPEDTLHLVISDEPEGRSMELSPNITVELNDKKEMIGVEILEASGVLLNLMQESFQATPRHVLGPKLSVSEQ